MRISIVVPSFYPATVYGGTIFSSLNNAKILAGLGHIVYVSTTNSNMKGRLNVPVGKFVEIEQNLFVKYYNETIVDRLSISLLLNVWKDIRKADFVHIQAIFNTPVLFALLYAKLLNKSVLLSPHGVLGEWIMGNGFQFKKLWLKLFIKPFAHNIKWHATSELEKLEIFNHFPLAKVIVIPNAINTEDFNKANKLSKADFLNKFANLSGHPSNIIVSMGRLHKKKGFEVLILAFKRVLKKYPKTYLFIAGEDEGEKLNLINLIERNNLSDKVFFTGNLEGQDKIDFLSNADLFVLPSHNENFGIVYAEALAAGTPIVASKETPWEGVEKFKCGKWVNNTVEENECAILEILSKNDQSLRVNAKEYAKRFSFNNVAEKFEEFLIDGQKNA